MGVLGRAIERGTVAVNATTPREFATDVHKTVDDRPYGGGPGMVLKIEPTRTSIRAAKARLPDGSRSVYLAADGAPLSHAKAQELAKLPGLLLLAGRYEGVDERLIESEIDECVSIGDYVLSGGELPALVLIDAVVELLPGVLGDDEPRRRRIRSSPGCSIGRITRGRKCSRGRRCLRCWSAAIMPRSAAGESSRRSGAPGCDGRT